MFDFFKSKPKVDSFKHSEWYVTAKEPLTFIEKVDFVNKSFKDLLFLNNDKVKEAYRDIIDILIEEEKRNSTAVTIDTLRKQRRKQR